MKRVNFLNSSTKVKIAFVGDFKYNFGSSNTILNYVKTGANLGYDIRVSEFGYIDNVVRRSVPVAEKRWKPDLFVFLYENYQFLSDKHIDQICSFIPRSKRILVDLDGKYSPPESASGDTNHSTPDSCKYWKEQYEALSDKILQPTVKPIVGQKKVKQFIFFGIGECISNPITYKQSKEFDLIYVGNNWYRWSDVYSLVKSINSIRSRVKRVGLFGEYWSNEVLAAYEGATYSDVNFLRINNIEVHSSVPYAKLEAAMGKGLMNPIFVRPIINKFKFVSPRMFETFSADTVPLIPNYFTHASDLYGNYAKKLTLSNNPANDILKILDNYKTYKNLCYEIREMLKMKHSYEVRLKQLLSFA